MIEPGALSGLPPFPSGSTTVVLGPSGAGKSGMLLALGGLLPEARGQLPPWGDVHAAGHPLAEAFRRGHGAFMFQNPVDGLCTDRCADELALAMEACGLPRAMMEAKVREWLDLLGLYGQRDVPVSVLSGGQQQRLAMGAVLAGDPEVVLIDEALSQLDPEGRERLLQAFDAWRARHPEGVAVVVEHRPALWGMRFDRALVWKDGSWEPCPPPSPVEACRPLARAGVAGREPAGPGQGLLRCQDLVPGRKGASPWNWPRGLDLEVGAGTVMVLIGPNGGGKSTLLQTMAGLVRPGRGKAWADRPAMALQNPELQFGPGLVSEHDPEPDFAGPAADASPFALSLGQQRRLSLSMLDKEAGVYFLDEPFYGQDPASVRAIMAWMVTRRARGALVVLSCHDHDLAWAVGHVVIHVDRDGWHHAQPPGQIRPWWEGAAP